MQDKTASVANCARWLGVAGILPFVGSALVLALTDALTAAAIRSLVGYGAVILSFLGGVRWGLAISGAVNIGQAGSNLQLLLSVIPSVIAWIALLLPPSISLWTLAASFIVMLWLDWTSGRTGHFPLWYARLRLPLSIAAIASLGLGLASVNP